MRITFVVPLLDVSGGSRIVAGHARNLASRGHDVLVVAPAPPVPGLKQKVRTLFGFGPVPVPREKSHYALESVPIHVGSQHQIGTADVPDADVIVATWWETAEWVWNLPPEKGAKVHFIQHYEAFPQQPAERVDAVWRLPLFKVAVAQWLIDLGRERFGIEGMALVPNSVDHHLFLPRKRTKGHPPTVGFLFHESAYKDIPTTLGAASMLKRKMPGARLISFGGNRPRKGELPPEVEFYHLPKQEEIAQIYGRCDAWLSTSLTEGFNLPPLEAMASGCPAVCSKTGRPFEIIKDGVNGYLVDQQDTRGFANALESILSLSDDDWAAMSSAASRTVAHPTWQESSALFEDALSHSMTISA